MLYKSYLSHHGVKGQKWGVENGPPYPLNDVVKAIAYRGGEMSDGRKVANFTRRDVRKARKIVNKNMKAMTTEEFRQFLIEHREELNRHRKTPLTDEEIEKILDELVKLKRGEISLPKGQSANFAILKCCIPKGTPTMVTHKRSPNNR